MIIKTRFKPLELQLLRCLHTRGKATEKVDSQITSLEKGYIGEELFDQKLVSLTIDCLILNDLLLETNNTYYQIDSLLISEHKIHIFEVKNYEGDYVINGDRWQNLITEKEIKNPLLQLMRSESLFRQLLKQLGSNLTVEGHLVFINPGFFLYQAPPNLPIIYPSQLTRFMNSLNTQSSRIVEKHHKFAKKLLTLHIKESPFSLLPASQDRLREN